ncbi:NADH-quinone oxidoreductase subunit NuoE [Woodsholea maritima]|uniref:NADH-quinone oxidoreductase subunit NuoE n=1 Tax=Woodsholea maritima TaxID=240237 RepID=UPI000372EA01|nr:NADH-quinone oxidoreductase subunit NuoE [Woodsholea maritima]
MSVRRLAAEQPQSFAFSAESEEKVQFWLKKYPEDRAASAVIPLLWLAQKQEGWVSEPAIRLIGERLGMPYIRVYEVATFYTMFNLTPVGEHLIQVCGTTPCWLRGADDLKAVCEKRIGKKGRENLSADGKFSWEEVECLGACANAPMVQIANKAGDYYYEDLTAEGLEKILDDLQAGKEIKQGPISGRHASEPTQSTVETLKDPSLYDGSRAKPITLPNSEPAKAEG